MFPECTPEPRQRGENRDYRRPNDDEWVIRVKQRQPKGTPKKLHSWVQVAGVSYRRADVERFIRGSRRQVSLQREPDNPHSDTAIARQQGPGDPRVCLGPAGQA
ncbi:MAG: hypothetical protein ACOC9X_05350 [bacterium]